jgi:hypothetical protein
MRQMLTADLSWSGLAGQEHFDALDTNSDGEVAPSDVLVIANAVHRPGGAAAMKTPGGRHPLDVNQDFQVNEADADLIIAALNDRAARASQAVEISFSTGLDSAGAPSSALDLGGGGGDDNLEGESGGGNQGESGWLFGGPTSPAVTITTAPTDVHEFELFTISGTATNAYSVDVQGDGAFAVVSVLGSTPYGVEFDPGAGTWTALVTFTDDDPTATPNDSGTITVTAFGGGGSASASTTIQVHNTDPTVSLSILEPTDGELKEGESASVLVRVTDWGADENHLVVDWGDGTSDQILESSGDPGTGSLAPLPLSSALAIMEHVPHVREYRLSHTYVDDDPSGTPEDIYTISATVTEDDTGRGDDTQTIMVGNADPQVFIDSITADDTVLMNERIDEGEGFRVEGTLRDAGVQDTHLVTLKADLNFDGDFADTGETAQLSLTPGPFAHDFGAVVDDGPSPGNSSALDELDFRIEVVDDDTGRVSLNPTVTVHNVAPQFDAPPTISVELDENGRPSSATISGTFVDPGREDAHEVNVAWSLERGSGPDSVHLSPGETSFSITRTFPPNDRPLGPSYIGASVQVQDDDTGQAAVCAGTDASCSDDRTAPAVDGPSAPADLDPTLALAGSGGALMATGTAEGDDASVQACQLGDGQVRIRKLGTPQLILQFNKLLDPDDPYIIVIPFEDFDEAINDTMSDDVMEDLLEQTLKEIVARLLGNVGTSHIVARMKAAFVGLAAAEQVTIRNVELIVSFDDLEYETRECQRFCKRVLNVPIPGTTWKYDWGQWRPDETDLSLSLGSKEAHDGGGHLILGDETGFERLLYNLFTEARRNASEEKIRDLIGDELGRITGFEFVE